MTFVLVLFLALEGGGYGSAIRGEVGVAIWWGLLVGVVAGLLPLARVGRTGWVVLGMLAAFAVWTALGISWSESSESSVTELGRVATYLGVFALTTTIQVRGALRATLYGLAGAIAVVAVLALLSRLHPQWFPSPAAVEFLQVGRLSYPLNYWNGLANLMAIGIPLLVWIASSSRRIAPQAIATAAIPILALTIFFTLSRGGIAETAAALLVLVALHPHRLRLAAPLGLASIGSAALISAALSRDDLTDGRTTGVALDQGSEMLLMVVLVSLGIGLLAGAAGVALRHGLINVPRLPKRTAVALTGGVVLVGILAAVAFGAPDALSDRWNDFKQPYDINAQSQGVDRLGDPSGGSRYQFWQSALDANETAPLNGIGPGTFEFWWARNGTAPVYVRDAHSLYFETLAELGIVGLLLIVALIGSVLVVGARRAMRRHRGRASTLAAATAAATAFAVGAGIDWAWELAVLPVAFLIVGAAIVGPDARRPDRDRSEPRPFGVGRRAALGLFCVAALVAVAIPLAGSNSIESSRAAASTENLKAALGDAADAAAVQPYAASPELQSALVLEAQGDIPGALAAARKATAAESTNWRTWFTLSRIAARSSDPELALSSYEKAKTLNPRSPLFATTADAGATP